MPEGLEYPNPRRLRKKMHEVRKKRVHRGKPNVQAAGNFSKKGGTQTGEAGVS